MTFFRSYFDESGKFKDHRVVSFCGVLGSPESLKSFNEAWESLLRKNGLVSFHTKHALKCTRAMSELVREQLPEERCETIKPFIECILDHLDLGIGISLDVTAYSKWVPGSKKRVGGSDDPAYVAFQQAAMAVKLYALKDDDRVSMMCDDDTGTALNFYQLYRHMKKVDPELKKKLVALSFADDEAYPPLQAADLIAGLIRLESLKRFGYHPHSFGSLVEILMKPKSNQKMRWIGFIGDPIQMEEMGNRIGKIKGRGARPSGRTKPLSRIKKR